VSAQETQGNRFANWLNATMQSRGLTQAQLARVVGVADTQVSRWRRGQVVPSVHYLQRIADTLEVPRVDLDRLAGYPVTDAAEASPSDDPQLQAELQAYEAEFRRLLQSRVPRELWRAYVEACAALAASMGQSFQDVLREIEHQTEASSDSAQPEPEDDERPGRRPAGFRR
jgi:transcriptional regulator with XRE-family HTH domain